MRQKTTLNLMEVVRVKKLHWVLSAESAIKVTNQDIAQTIAWKRTIITGSTGTMENKKGRYMENVIIVEIQDIVRRTVGRRKRTRANVQRTLSPRVKKAIRQLMVQAMWKFFSTVWTRNRSPRNAAKWQCPA